MNLNSVEKWESFKRPLGAMYVIEVEADISEHNNICFRYAKLMM